MCDAHCALQVTFGSISAYCPTFSYQVIGSIVHLSGEIHFVNNKGGEDSALHLLSFSQAVLGTGLLINFKGNSGR